MRTLPFLYTTASRPWPSGGGSSATDIGITDNSAEPKGRHPSFHSGKSLLSPAIAIRTASYRPSTSCARRESIAPRIGSSFALENRFLAYPERRSLDTPILIARFLTALPKMPSSALRTTQQSLGSSRSGSQNQSKSSATGSGKSFAECIAKSILPSRTASSRSRVKKSGALFSMGVERSLSPGVTNAIKSALKPSTDDATERSPFVACAMDSLLPLAPHFIFIFGSLPRLVLYCCG